MTDLADFLADNRATPVNQYRGGGEFPMSDCGESSVMSVLIDFGHPRPMRAVEEWIEAEGVHIEHGSGPVGWQSCLSAAGVAAEVVHGHPADIFPTALTTGQRIIWCVAADFDRSTGSHAIVVDGCDPQGVHFMNPSGGKYEALPWEQLAICSRDAGVMTCDPVPTRSAGLHQVDLEPPSVTNTAYGYSAVVLVPLLSLAATGNPNIAWMFFWCALACAWFGVAALRRKPRLRLSTCNGVMTIERLLTKRRIPLRNIGHVAIDYDAAASQLRLRISDRTGRNTAALPLMQWSIRPLIEVLAGAELLQVRPAGPAATPDGEVATAPASS